MYTSYIKVILNKLSFIDHQMASRLFNVYGFEAFLSMTWQASFFIFYMIILCFCLIVYQKKKNYAFVSSSGFRKQLATKVTHFLFVFSLETNKN